MNKLSDFLDAYYKKAIKLSEDFNKTREYDWNPLLILNELSIQIGHVYNIVYHNSNVNETNHIKVGYKSHNGGVVINYSQSFLFDGYFLFAGCFTRANHKFN